MAIGTAIRIHVGASSEFPIRAAQPVPVTRCFIQSTTSICPSDNLLSPELSCRWTGPMPIIRGATPAAAEATTRALGVNPWRFSAVSEPRVCTAPSFTPDAFRSGDRAIRLDDRFQFRKRFQRRVRPGCFISRNVADLFFSEWHANQFPVIPSVSDASPARCWLPQDE